MAFSTTMLLCDAAQEVGGKLYILGAGWTNLNTPDQPTSLALAILIEVPWEETNRTHQIELKLLDVDGNDFVDTNLGAPVRNEATLRVGRPPEAAQGVAIQAPMIFAWHGLVFPTGRYVWVLTIGGEEAARRPFQVGAPQ